MTVLQKSLDSELKEYEINIRGKGIEFIWFTGEQLYLAKQKVIELTNDKRAPGFIKWAEDKFNWIKMTVSRYIKAYKENDTNIKNIWGNNKSVTLTLPNKYFPYNIWNTHKGDDNEYYGHFPSLFMKNL